MTSLERLKKTCSLLGIALPVALISMSAPQIDAPKEDHKKELSRNLEAISLEMHDSLAGSGSHINSHTNKTVRGIHTDRHSNSSTAAKG